MPWVASELGWVVAEYGRQPWAIDGVLPTFLGVSSRSAGEVTLSLLGFVVLYTTLAVVDVFLLKRTIKAGPDGLGYWPRKGQDPANMSSNRRNCTDVVLHLDIGARTRL